MARYFLTIKRAVIFSLSFFLSACISSQASLDKQQAAKARVELALGYLYQHNFAQAKLNLDKALQHAPHYDVVHVAYAYFYQKQGDREKAKSAYLTAIKLDNQQGNTKNNFGAFLCEQGEFSAAFTQFEQALQAENYYAQADTYENIARCALSANEKEKYQQAIFALQKLDHMRAVRLQKIAQQWE